MRSFSKQFFFYTIFTTALVLASCVAVTFSPTDTPSGSRASPSVDLLITSPTPTTQPTPKATSESVSETPQVAVMPTLTVEAVQDIVVELLRNNADCKLPCWWGIVPDATTWEAARDFFVARGIGWHEDRLQGGWLYNITYEDVSYPFTYRFNVVLTRQDESIGSIAVDSEGGLLSSHFAEDWRPYSLDQVLTQYGRPSEVMLNINLPRESNASTFYSLYILYESQGIAIKYMGIAENNETDIRVCPMFEQVSNIGLRLQSLTSVTQLLDAILLPDERSYVLSLQDATDTDISTFYESFRVPSPNLCLETSTELWP